MSVLILVIVFKTIIVIKDIFITLNHVSCPVVSNEPV